MSSKKLEFVVPEKYDNTKLGVFLRRECEVSARIIAQLKRENCGILRDNKIIRTIDAVKEGDRIVLNLKDENNEIVPVKGDLTILYEDDYVIVFDKPYGIPVHPTKVHQLDTLANYHSYRQKELGENYKFRAVNRIDKDTSGIVVVAKDKYTASFLQNHIDKTYYAVCEGELRGKGTIDKPISLKEGHSIQRACTENGAKSITRYEAIKTKNNHTLLKIKLETGRTHQIRVHFSSIGHPLSGDDMYGGSLVNINRQALHCGEVIFRHPFLKKDIIIKCELPEDIKKLTL